MTVTLFIATSVSIAVVMGTRVQQEMLKDDENQVAEFEQQGFDGLSEGRAHNCEGMENEE